jgi:hypothetical protein
MDIKRRRVPDGRWNPSEVHGSILLDQSMLTGESLPIEGVADLNSALERDPNNQIALLGRGTSVLISDQFDRAIIVFNQTIGNFTDDTSIRLLRTGLSGAAGHPESMFDVDYVYSVRPGDPELPTVRGQYGRQCRTIRRPSTISLRRLPSARPWRTTLPAAGL